MTRRFLQVTALLSMTLIVWACGGKSGEGQKTEAAQPLQQETVRTEDPQAAAAKAEGEAVAKEILDTFDKAVAEAAELANGKPEASLLKPQIEALIEKYQKPMADLNVRFLALKSKDIRSFGAADGYMGENRGRHVNGLYNALNPAIAHYNFEKGDQEMVDILTKNIIGLIDIAVRM